MSERDDAAEREEEMLDAMERRRLLFLAGVRGKTFNQTFEQWRQTFKARGRGAIYTGDPSPRPRPSPRLPTLLGTRVQRRLRHTRRRFAWAWHGLPKFWRYEFDVITTLLIVMAAVMWAKACE